MVHSIDAPRIDVQLRGANRLCRYDSFASAVSSGFGGFTYGFGRPKCTHQYDGTDGP